MTINSKTFATLVSDQITAIQGTAAALVDSAVGSVLRAIAEANAAIALWLQGLVLTLLTTSRAATANAGDLDSWMADYNFPRLPAVAAVGNVTFARYTPTFQAVIPIGATLQSADGSQQYAVALNAALPAYSAGASGYIIPAGQASLTNVPVVAVTPGAAGNAAVGLVNTITSPISGVDTVTNPLTFSLGADQELDAAFRVRFVAWINSLSKATPTAIRNAVAALGQTIYCTLVEGYTYAGVAQSGFFFAVIDDGSGAPSGAILTAATNAIDAVRPIASSFAVYSPVVIAANVALTCTVVAGYDATATRAAVAAAITAYLNGLKLGTGQQYTRLVQVAYDASPGVQNISGLTLNGGTADIGVTGLQVIKAGTVVVS